MAGPMETQSKPLFNGCSRRLARRGGRRSRSSSSSSCVHIRAFVSAAAAQRNPIVGRWSRKAPSVRDRAHCPAPGFFRFYPFPDGAGTMHRTPYVGDIARVYFFGLTTGELCLPVLCPGSPASGRGSYRPFQDAMRAENKKNCATATGLFCRPFQGPGRGRLSESPRRPALLPALALTQTAASVIFHEHRHRVF